MIFPLLVDRRDPLEGCLRGPESLTRKGGCSVGTRGPLGRTPTRPHGCLRASGQFTAGINSGDPSVSSSCSSDGPLLGGPVAIAAGPLAVCKESMLHPTRLETRTKESNMYASQWALSKPTGAMKVNAYHRADPTVG